MLAFCSSPRFADHDTGPHHPERPDRIRAIHRAVRDAGLIDSPDPFPEFEIDLGVVAATPASPASARRGATQASRLLELEPVLADEKWIRLVHPQHYIDHARRVCE